MLHSKITPGEQSWNPHNHTITAFCFPQHIYHSFLGYECWKKLKEAEMDQAEIKKILFFLTGLVSHEGISGFGRLGFNLLLSADCVTESRVRFVVSYFWGIFHPE